jgi:hypothetical protein
MSHRVSFEIQKSVRIRSHYKGYDGRERVSRSKAYTSPHSAAKAYAQSSTHAWAMRNGHAKYSIITTALISEREKKVYARVRPFFDKMFDK